MLYRILQWIMRRSLSVHYLQIKADLQKVPKKGPLLIAATHPNSFLDALIIACLIDRPLHFLARSDVFNTTWSNYILRQLNLIPIYRKQEGKEKLSNNKKTFNESSKILAENGALLIFVEGISVMDMKLRPLKKGLGRIILEYFKEKPGSSIKIANIGINYDRPKEFRSKVLIANGDNININNDWLNGYSHPHTAIRELNQQIYKELQDHTIEVEPSNELEFRALSEMDSSFRENSLSRKILIAKVLRKMQELHPIQASRLKEDCQKANRILEQYKLNFRKLKVNKGLDLSQILIWILLAPLALVALVINILPFLLGKWITDSTVKLEEFYASVRIVVNTLLWMFMHFGLMIYLLEYHWIAILYPVLAFQALRFYMWFREHTHYIRSTIRLMRLRRNKETFNELQTLMKEIYRIRASFGLAPK